ncbi:para-aminobenzoic acid synthetase, putative [Plasmodium malariae]|uniref:aminodeoxychorismate synthase n=1 Tax=Plasmodium malariae TaxID=5858 RepID=A0A1A8VTR9_PLAMA|nr:para-aminobenzoic acid synthetase, putative [Plasmodium malariae]SBS83932.1 para-aminobenzoic acid synthetase, putative [Plasmodium malariae]SBT87877.1 para-aminobenzoic acid synthetase, putative [Plasmodium malariae]
MGKHIVSLFIDNYDSYSYNIVNYLHKVNRAEPIIVYPDKLNFNEFMRNYYDIIDNIVISPGYGNPETNTNNDLVIEILKNKINMPILGICYGHQLICYFYGCKIEKVKNMFHGNTNIINICNDERRGVCVLFNNIKDKFKAVCYNSLKVSEQHMSDKLHITCYSIYLNEYIVMGTQHKHLPYYTVQYHPESVGTDFNIVFFENFKNITLKYINTNKDIKVNILEYKLSTNFEKKKIKNVKNGVLQQCTWKLTILNIVGLKNICAIAYEIFKNIAYCEDDICFWLDSNHEILYKEKERSSIEGGNTTSDKVSFDEMLNNSRFSYMGNTKGVLSEVIEYYYCYGTNNHERNNLEKGSCEERDCQKSNCEHFNSVVVNLTREKSGNKYRINYHTDKHDSCLVHHLNERIERFKDNFTIDYKRVHIHDLLESSEKESNNRTYESNRTNISRSANVSSNIGLGTSTNTVNGQKKLLEYCVNGYNEYSSGENHGDDGKCSKNEVEEDEFINSKDSCLMGYFGFFNYEYKYETIKNIYGKKYEHVRSDSEEGSYPVSVFILPQNFIALNMPKNSVYLISLLPEEQSFKSYLSSLPNDHNINEMEEKLTMTELQNGLSTSSKRSPCDYHSCFHQHYRYSYEDIKNYNDQWIYGTSYKIRHIVKNLMDEKSGYKEWKGKENKDKDHNAIVKDVKLSKFTFTSSLSKEMYIENIKACKEYIEKGHSYELCLTTKFKGSFCTKSELTALNLLDLYKYMRTVNKVSYSCYIHYDRTIVRNEERGMNDEPTKKIVNDKLKFTILCFSPEEFLRKNKDSIMFSKPIKGTIERGKTEEDDNILKDKLFNDKKERSENLMIVDLTTNDFNRICERDTVKVVKLFHIETYTFLHQMVSKITGKIKHDKTFADAIINIFPGGSMTGSPKFISMSILQNIENTPRGIYSGSIGFISIQGNFIFNIVIRTAIIKNDNISIGAGGAITIKSDEKEEYNEMLLKFMSIARPISYYLKERHSAEVEYRL